MDDEIYLCANAPWERHEAVVTDFVAPLAREIRESPELSSLFFVRMDTPAWQVRLRVVGAGDWIAGACRETLDRHLAPHLASGLIDDVDTTRYEREVTRYGGEEGMALAEEIYLHDSLACLDFIELEGRGELGRDRRELALILGERFADLLRLTPTDRAHYYHFGHKWTHEMGTWDENDYAQLDQRYAALRPQLLEMSRGDTSRDLVELWGGEAAAAVAEGFLAAVRPVIERVREGHAAGRIRQEISYLGWSYTHLLCNRLGLHPIPEAILRYLMHRFLDDEHPGIVPGPRPS